MNNNNNKKKKKHETLKSEYYIIVQFYCNIFIHNGKDQLILNCCNKYDCFIRWLRQYKCKGLTDK